MDSVERFWFASPNIRLRSSTVEGLSNTASLCVETRLDASGESSEATSEAMEPSLAVEAHPALGGSLLGW
jgi:hypothetical protein